MPRCQDLEAFLMDQHGWNTVKKVQVVFIHQRFSSMAYCKDPGESDFFRESFPARPTSQCLFPCRNLFMFVTHGWIEIFKILKELKWKINNIWSNGCTKCVQIRNTWNSAESLNNKFTKNRTRSTPVRIWAWSTRCALRRLQATTWSGCWVHPVLKTDSWWKWVEIWKLND